MRTIKLCFYGLLVVLFSVFILQNYSTLTYSVALRLNLGFLSLMSVPVPLFLAVPLFFFFGLFLATIIGWGKRRRLSKEIKQLKSARPEPKPGFMKESRPEPRPEPKPEPQKEPRPEARPEPEPKKKPDEGTIVSYVPLFKKTDSPPGKDSSQHS